MKGRSSRFVSLILVGILLVLSAGAVSGCSADDSGKTLRIGVIGPETGAAAQLGQAQRNSVQMAVDEINSAGGVNGRKLEVYFEDDQGNPTQSANAANKLIQQSKVSVIIGAIHSSCTLADMVVTQRASIPQITAGSTGASITEQGNPWIFRTAVNDGFQAKALLDYAVNTLGIKKAATFTALDDYGQSGAKLLKEAAEKAGLQLVVTATYNNGDKDFKPQLLSIRSAEAEGIFLWGLYTEAALIARQARQLDINVQLFGASGMAAQKLMELGGDAVEGMILTQSFLASADDPRVRAYVDKYRQKFNQNPIPHGAQAYDTVYIIADALKRANSTSPKALRDAIAATAGQPGVTGNAKFNTKGDDIGKRVLLTQIKDGKFVLIKGVFTGE